MNPSLFKILLALKTRNGIVISPHPRAKNSTIMAAKIVLDAAVKAGAPKDIVAWIEIENTPVNYPILKDNNNLYYLKHNFNKKYNSNGSIFTLNKDFIQDDEVIIYGHNMRNKTMFSILGNYLNTNFLKEHQIMKI